MQSALLTGIFVPFQDNDTSHLTKSSKPSHAQSVEQQYDDLKNSDLEIYEPRKCNDEYERMFTEAVILINGRLIRLTDITLEQWLDLKFGDHRKVDKEVLESVKRGDDEEMLTDDELSNLDEKNKENEIAGIFRIEIDLFQFDMPLCKAFKDFNYLL
ncbi:hypothetical protein Tco_0111305 [Tanacetum coccineum]